MVQVVRVRTRPTGTADLVERLRFHELGGCVFEWPRFSKYGMDEEHDELIWMFALQMLLKVDVQWIVPCTEIY